MSSLLFIWSYRLFAVLTAISPIFINVMVQGDIVSSLIYAPLASLVLAAGFIYLERSVFAFSCQCSQLKNSGQQLIKQKLTKSTQLPLFNQSIFKITLPCCHSN